MADRIPGFVWLTDTDLRITAAFGAGLAALNVQPSQFVGKTIFEYFQSEDENLPGVAVHRRALRGEVVDYEDLFLGRAFRAHIEPLVDEANHVIGCVGFAQDITERKQAEASLRESERRLNTLMANLPGMAYRCRNDPQWTMQFVSDGCAQLTGYQASELTNNRIVAYGNIIHPDDRRAVWEQVQQALTERRRFQLEYRIRTARGDEKWVWEQGVGVFSAAGELQLLEGFITDITARRNAEAALRQAHDELEQKVAERTAELREANARLLREVEQRRQAEADLAIFRRFADAATQGFGMADVEGRITYVNPFLARMYAAAKPEDVIGTHVATHYPPDYPLRREREIIPALRRGTALAR